MKSTPLKKISKKVKRGFRGYPVATIAFYGPDNKRATKVAVGIVLGDDADATEMKKWFSEKSDVRMSEAIGKEITEFVRGRECRSVVLADKIIGCPHEEGIDYPEGESCPSCPFWAGPNRFTGELEH